MKSIKITSIFACLLMLAVSCSKESELSKANAGKERPVVTIEQNNVTNYYLTFTVSTGFPASQFGYVVMPSTSTQAPVAQDIVMDQIGTALQSGVFNTVDKTKVKVEFDCEPDANYIVYAAAITDEGVLSEVASCPIHVTDTEIPSIVAARVEGNVLTLTFSEKILLSQEGSATIQYIKFGEGVVTSPENLPLEYISVEDNVATFNCPRPGNGAGYVVSYSYGLFTDVNGNKAYGVVSSFDIDTEQGKNLFWAESPVDFTVDDSYFKMVEDPAAWKQDGAAIEITFPFDVYANPNLDKAVSVVYAESDKKEYAYAEFTIENKRVMKVVLPRSPKAAFDVHIDRGAIFDTWGNLNAEYEVPSSGFKYTSFDVILGTYSVPSSAGAFNMTFTSEGGSVVNLESDWFNIGRDLFGSTDPVMPVLRGTIDYAKMTITFDGQWYYRGALQTEPVFGNALYYADAAQSQFLVFWGSGTSGVEPIVVSIAEDGTLVSITEFEYALHTTSGAYLRSYGFVESGSALTFVE